MKILVKSWFNALLMGIKFWLAYHKDKESPHEISSSIDLVVSEKTMFNILMEFNFERPLKGQRSTLTFGTFLKPLSHNIKHIK